MRRKLYSFIQAVVMLTVCTHANAQDSSRANHLNEVVVTATKFAKKAGESGKVVTVISSDYLQKNSGKSLSSILNSQAGLVVNGAENAPGTNQDVYMRGASTGNTLVLIDGIPVNDASQISNAFDLNFIPVTQIERIEILRGSQSTLYGSDAVAGVINIITKKPGDKKAGISANGAFGTYKTWQGGAGVNGSIGKFSYLGGYQYMKSDGFSSAYDSLNSGTFDKDGFKRHSVFGKIGFQATKRWKLQYIVNWSDYKAGLDEAAFTDDQDYTMKNKYLLNTISSRYDFNKGSWTILYSYQRNKRHLQNDSGYIAKSDFPSKYYEGTFESNTHQAETYVNWDVTKELQLLAGAEFRTSNTDQSTLFVDEFMAYPPTKLSPDSAHARQFSHYASLLLHNPGGFNLEVGGRFNYHNIYGNNQTISFNPSYLINNRHKIFINISSAYKVPTLYQLYSEYGNKDLQPESSINYEGGYQGALFQDKLNLRVVGFQRETRDLIIFYTEPVTFRSYYRNADKQKAYGGELEASYQIIGGLNLTVNYTYVTGKLTQQDTSYYNLYRRPKHALNAELGYQVTPGLYVSTQYKYISKRWESVFGKGDLPLGDYYTLGAYAEYKLGQFFKVFGDFRNITDQQYFDVRGYTARKFNFTAGMAINL
ncbi:MAG TPA: TonB-dependent receptor [Chitinophaga sp.]